MAGAKIDFDHKDVSAKIGAAIQGLDNPGPLFQIIHRIPDASASSALS